MSIDDATADGSSRMNSEVYRAILSDQIQANAVKVTGESFRVQMDDTQEVLKPMKTIFSNSQVSHIASPQTKHVFLFMNTKPGAERPKNKQKLKADAVKALQSISREKTQHLVMSMVSKLLAVILVFPVSFEALKIMVDAMFC